MHKRLVALPGRQAAEHRRGGGREVVSISRVEGRTGDKGADFKLEFALTSRNK